MAEPNRNSGDWLPGASECPTRLKPCGNTACADLALMARDILAANQNIVSKSTADQALKEARRTAKHCEVLCGECPMEKFFKTDRFSVIDILSA